MTPKHKICNNYSNGEMLSSKRSLCCKESLCSVFVLFRFSFVETHQLRKLKFLNVLTQVPILRHFSQRTAGQFFVGFRVFKLITIQK